VTGVDIDPQLLAAAADLSAHIWPPVEFRLGDAEKLQFDDGAFDGVISTFGVMFAANQAEAAAELARVCRSGGRRSWQHGRRMGLWQNFSGSNAHSDAPPPRSSPLAWGNPPYVKQLLGDSFELEFEHGVSHTYHGGVEDIRQWYTRGLRTVASARREPSSGPRATAQARRRCLSSALRCSSRAAREA